MLARAPSAAPALSPPSCSLLAFSYHPLAAFSRGWQEVAAAEEVAGVCRGLARVRGLLLDGELPATGERRRDASSGGEVGHIGLLMAQVELALPRPHAGHSQLRAGIGAELTSGYWEALCRPNVASVDQRYSARAQPQCIAATGQERHAVSTLHSCIDNSYG